MYKVAIKDKDLNETFFYKVDEEADIFVEEFLRDAVDPDSYEIVSEKTTRAKILGTDAVQKEVMECTAKLISSWDGRKTLGGKKPPVHADISLEIDGVLQGKIGITPTATVGTWRLYGKLNNKLYFQDSAGIEHEVAFGLL